MAFFIIKEAGTAGATTDDGRVTSLTAESFATRGAANYYDDVADAVNVGKANPPVAGDILVFSDLSIDVEAVVPTYSIPAGVMCLSVDDSDMSVQKDGATFDNTTAGVDDEIILDGIADEFTSWTGFNFISNEFVVIANDQGHGTLLERCIFDKKSVSGTIFNGVSSSGGSRSAKITLKDCIIDALHDSNTVSLACDGIVDNLMAQAGHTLVNTVVTISSSLGSSNLIVRNSDITKTAKSTGKVVGLAAADNGKVHIERCVLGASQTLHDTIPNPIVEVWAYSVNTGDGYFMDYYANFFGAVAHDYTTYLDTTYDGTTGVSLVIDSTADCDLLMPFECEICTLGVQDLTASKDIEIEFCCAATLTDAEFYFKLVRNDGADMALGVEQSGIAPNILSGTTHTTSSSTWTAGLTNKYKQSLTITGMTGVTNGEVKLIAVLTKPSETVNVDIIPKIY